MYTYCTQTIRKSLSSNCYLPHFNRVRPKWMIIMIMSATLCVRFDCVSLSFYFILFYLYYELDELVKCFHTYVLKMVEKKKHRSLINRRVNEIHWLAQFKRTKIYTITIPNIKSINMQICDARETYKRVFVALLFFLLVRLTLVQTTTNLVLYNW